MVVKSCVAAIGADVFRVRGLRSAYPFYYATEERKWKKKTGSLVETVWPQSGIVHPCGSGEKEKENLIVCFEDIDYEDLYPGDEGNRVELYESRSDALYRPDGRRCGENALVERPRLLLQHVIPNSS